METIELMTIQTVKQPTDNNETFLLEKNIRHLKRMFKCEENYKKYLGTLWLLRNLISENIDICSNPNPIAHPQFPIWELTNELIGSLLRPDTSFSCNEFGVHYSRQGCYNENP